MALSEHTPGPWLPEERDSAVYPYSVTDRHGRSVALVVEAYAPEDSSGNARLIAAAPDMLEALKLVLRDADYEAEHVQPPTVSTVRTAIAKAEGRK